MSSQASDSLNFKAGYESTVSLIDAENECRAYFARKYRATIGNWEYAYYYLSLFIMRSTIHPSYAPLASLYSESHSSLRSVFLLNNQGYHPEALSLLRRVHECFSKMVGIKKWPQTSWKIISNTSIQGIEAKLGINLKWIYELESSFLHGNMLEAISIAKKLQDKETQFGIEYGPQKNDMEYQVVMNLSMFWIGSFVLVAPKVFVEQTPQVFLQKYDGTIEFIKEYLKGLPKNQLLEEFQSLELMLDKLV